MLWRSVAQHLFRPATTATAWRMSLSQQAVLPHSDAVFVSVYNPTTGHNEWVQRHVDYDFAQETARSGYADMLHDSERNVLYEAGLRAVVNELQAAGQPVHVLDIGAGTGLLSLMAARLGAERVTAVEVFAPMAKVADQVIRNNGYKEKITLINKRSTDLESAEVADKPNVCVAEVFDTELIGEGALRVFKEAIHNVLQPGARVVPSRAHVWVQPVQSTRLTHWHSLKHLRHAKGSVRIPSAVQQCTGVASVHDLQLSELSADAFQPVGPPINLYNFDFERPTYEYTESVVRELRWDADEKLSHVDALLFWWTIDMDGSGAHILSCQPHFDRPQPHWRDHWMQAVYYLPHPVPLPDNSNSRLWLQGCHDEYSWWFDAFSSTTEPADRPPPEPPACSCTLHVLCSRNNLARLNDKELRAQYCRAVSNVLQSPNSGSVLCLGDVNLLPLYAAQLGAAQVWSVESNARARRLLHSFVVANQLQSTVHIVADPTDLPADASIGAVICEPFYSESSLPWHDVIRLWQQLQQIRSRTDRDIEIVPKAASVWCLPVHFEHLWKIREPVRSVLGFDLTPFAELMDRNIALADSAVEPHNAWEYASVALAAPTQVAAFDLAQPPAGAAQSINIQLGHDGLACNACVFWVELDLGGGVTVSRGLTRPCAVGHKPVWYKAYIFSMGCPIRQTTYMWTQTLMPKQQTLMLTSVPVPGDILIK